MSHEYERIPPAIGGLRLHLNENTAGCSPAVLEALRAIDAAEVGRYPDYDHALDVTASFLGVETTRVLLTNGLDEAILGLSIAALCAPAGRTAGEAAEAIVVEPAFDMYPACAAAVGGRVVSVLMNPDFSFPTESVLTSITRRTRIVFLTNPNNPTGQRITREAIRTVARALPEEALMLLDEAYVDFSGETFLDELSEHPNVVIGRTFAKAYGLAGLRVGVLIGTPEKIDEVRRLVPPYSVNAAAVRALPAAIADQAYVRRYVAEAEASRRLYEAACERLGVTTWPSAANFVLIRVGDRATEVAAALASRGVHVRDRSHQFGCAGCLRFTAGWIADTRRAIAALEEVL